MRKRHGPGLVVSDGSQPRLIALVADSAREAGVEPPREVSVDFAPRAEPVELRRSRRGLVVGLPLLVILSEAELRSVIAHALGSDENDAARRRIDAHRDPWRIYWVNHVQPALDARRRPPVLEGFAAFLRAAGQPLDGRPSARQLVDDIPELERRVIAEAAMWWRLEPMAWSEAGDVYLAGVRKSVTELAIELHGITAGRLGECIADLAPLSREVQRLLPAAQAEEAREIAVLALADSLLVALADAGWQITYDLDEPVRARLAGRALDPLDDVAALAEGTLSAAAWVARTRELGIADLPLGA